MTLVLRRATVDDAAAFARSMGDPRVYPNLMQVPYTNESIWRSRLADLTQPGKADLLLVAERDVDGRPEIVGSAGLHPVSPLLRQRHVAMLGISVVPEAWGQGVGSALMQGLCDFADRWMQILRLQLDVFADNAAALALYRKFGFEVEATQRAYALRDGAYVDSLAMGRLHPNPPAIPASGAEARQAAQHAAPRGAASGGWTLRAFDAADLDATAALMTRHGVVEDLLVAPATPAAQLRERLAEPAPGCAFVAVAEARVVGYASLAVPNALRRRHAGSLTIFVAPEWQQRGMGTALLGALLDWADGWAGLRRVEAAVQAGSEGALALLQRNGFAIEGTQRAAVLREGALVDLHVLARLHPRPPLPPPCTNAATR